MVPPVPPLADAQLELRAELGTALFSLLRTAQELGLATPAMGELHRLVTDLRAPFIFMVAGEVKAGKSTLLNALFGREVCETSVLPATDRLHKFQFALEESDVESGPELVDHYRPLNFLRDFHLVDTPGTNSIQPGQTHLGEFFAPYADAILFVFPVTNPWGASSWELLERFQKHLFRRVVIVVQQCDLREPHEIDLITKHLGQICEHRLGTRLPIFPVSAKLALLSKTSGLDKPRLRAESRIEALEEHLAGILKSEPERAARLHRAALSAGLELATLLERCEAVKKVLEADRSAILEMVRSLASKARDQLQSVENVHYDFDRALNRCWLRGEEMLRERLRPLNAVRLALQGDARWTASFRAGLEPVLRSTLTRQIESALGRVQSEMRTSRAQLTRMVEKWAHQTPPAEPDDVAGQAFRRRREVIAELEHSLFLGLKEESARGEMHDIFAEAAGDYIAREEHRSLDLSAALVRRLTELGLESAMAGLGQVRQGDRFGLFAFGRASKVIDAYHVTMTDRGGALAKSIETIFTRLVEIYYDRLMRIFAPYEEWRVPEQAHWDGIVQRLRLLEATFQRLGQQL
ncbi:MAG: dynamin family protein [Verrucomicrobia bacterium]|nr:dynamin family protein [Verrucomicrobiota bacterium]